jgi:O-antigen ligase
VPLAGWTFCLLVTVVTGSRMASLALLVAPIFHPLTRHRAWNLIAAGLLVLLALGLFYTPYFQQRFFYTGSGTLEDLFAGEFLSFGRFEAWPDIWDEAWLHPWLGAGVGTTYDFVPTVWPEMNHVHNDYLRLGFEVGLVGLAVFLGVVAYQLWDIRRQIRSSQGPLCEAFCACWLGLILLLVTGLTDNTLIYNLWYTDPLFALLGAAYGLQSQHDDYDHID